MSEHHRCRQNLQNSTAMNSFNQLLSRKNIKSKNKKPNGFTMIELMIGVAIVGTLSAVALPQLTKAQSTAKSSAARTTAINTAKTCSIALIGTDSTDGDVATADYQGDVKITDNTDITCESDAVFAFSGGEQDWKVELIDGVSQVAENVTPAT